MDWEDDYELEEIPLTEEDIDNIAFEKEFYELVAGTTEVQVIPIPNMDGTIISDQDIKLIEKECKKANLKLIFRVSDGNIASIFDIKTGLTGLMPEYNAVGFPC